MTLHRSLPHAAQEVLSGRVSLEKARIRYSSQQMVFIAVAMLHIAGRTDFPRRGLYGMLLSYICSSDRDMWSYGFERDKYVAVARRLGLHHSGGRGQHQMRLVTVPEIDVILSDEALVQSCYQWCVELCEACELELHELEIRRVERVGQLQARELLVDEFNAAHLLILEIGLSGYYEIEALRIAADNLQKLLARPEFTTD